MSERTYRCALIAVAASFTLLFCAIIIPALLVDRDIVGAFAAGFVNPYATGYSLDVVFCLITLVIWVVYEAKAHSVRYGWICVLLCFVPGVAVGFPLYLVLRHGQIQTKRG